MDTRLWLREQGEFDKDRAPPIHFAGRGNELGTILRRSINPLPGNTIVVQGAPGAGKTALLREAATQFSDSGGRALFYESPWRKEGEVHVLRNLAVASFKTDPGVFATTNVSSKSTQGKLFGIGGSLTKTEQKTPIELADWTAFLNQYGNSAAKARPVLILIDESQNFEKDAGELPRHLHTQSVFPFTLVCGGLSDTRDRLREIGISRLGSDATLRIVTLAQDEAKESISGALHWTLDKCSEPPIRHSARDIEQWVSALADASMAWPQHITSYLMGAWRSLADSERLDLSEEQNLKTALAHGEQLCCAYYDERIGFAKVDPRIALAVHRALLDNDQGALGQATVYNAIQKAVKNLDPPSAQIHSENHPDTLSCYRAMLKSGIIEECDAIGNLGVPIPSMTVYLERIVAGLGRAHLQDLRDC